MRYRPFSRTGIAVSTLSLKLNGAHEKRAPSDWRELVHGAFEEGVNAFELVNPSPSLLSGFAEGIAAVKRSLLFVGLRLDPALEGQRLEAWVELAVRQAGIGELNFLVADAGATRSDAVLSAMQRLKDSDLVRVIGVAGTGDLLQGDIETGFLDAVIAPFNMLSGWRDRNLVRTALERQMGVIASDSCPAELDELVEAAEAEIKPGWFKKAKPLAGAGTYAFLHKTPGWSAEQLGLAYALTEPSIATVQVEVTDRKHLAALASVTDRDLPSTVSAQIEMARFSAEGGDDASRRRA